MVLILFLVETQDNNFGDVGAQAIISALQGNSSLTILGLRRIFYQISHVSENRIGDLGVHQIGRLMKGNKIAYLDLSRKIT